MSLPRYALIKFQRNPHTFHIFFTLQSLLQINCSKICFSFFLPQFSVCLALCPAQSNQSYGQNMMMMMMLQRYLRDQSSSCMKEDSECWEYLAQKRKGSRGSCNVHKQLDGRHREDEAKLSEVLRDRIRGKELKLKHRRLHSSISKQLYCYGD